MKKNILFVWLPKNAGTSIYNLLKQYDCLYFKKYKRYIEFSNKGIVTFGHIDIKYLMKINVINSEWYNKTYKFAFVRNPWDRMVSFYHYLNLDDFISFEKFIFLFNKKYSKRNNMYAKIINFIFNTRIFNYFDMPFYVSQVLYKYKFLLLYIFPFVNIGAYHSIGLSQINPQVNWLMNKDNELIVDYIGKFENLENDINIIFNNFGINETIKLPHYNKTKHKNYRKYYNNKTKKIIEEIYKDDIKYFNYTF
jgi:hypothetical protein